MGNSRPYAEFAWAAKGSKKAYVKHNQVDKRPENVRSMFGRIAGRYDLLNRLMTFGQDRSWRRRAIQSLNPQAAERLLDIGAGTGDLTFEALRQEPSIRVTAADFTQEMLSIGRHRPGGQKAAWLIADTRQLPFADRSFDGVVSGFLLRNIADLSGALREQYRVLKEGGRWVSLETSPPADNLLRPLLIFYLRRIIPALGRLIAGAPAEYRYLRRSTENFLAPPILAGQLQQVGFRKVSYKLHMMGTIAIHSCFKPASEPESLMVD